MITLTETRQKDLGVGQGRGWRLFAVSLTGLVLALFVVILCGFIELKTEVR